MTLKNWNKKCDIFFFQTGDSESVRGAYKPCRLGLSEDRTLIVLPAFAKKIKLLTKIGFQSFHMNPAMFKFIQWILFAIYLIWGVWYFTDSKVHQKKITMAWKWLIIDFYLFCWSGVLSFIIITMMIMFYYSVHASEGILYNAVIGFSSFGFLSIYGLVLV